MLLERETALAELDRLRRDAARGTGRVVLLCGEAGVGKSTLIRRFVPGRDERVRVLRGWCDPVSAPRPFGPLIDMLGQLGAVEAAKLATALNHGGNEAIYARLMRLFGDGGVWVCVIEDMHWADSATLDLLRYLARRVGSLPVLMVVSYRDDEVGPEHPLAVALGDLATCAELRRIRLDPLSRGAVAMLTQDSGINVAELHRLTGGNPFFITEILAAGREALHDGALPRSVSEAVWSRLARLSSPAREVAAAAAICGPRGGTGLLEKVCPQAFEALDECLSAGVLCLDGQVVSFRHELARRATIQQIPAHRRREIHCRALAALAEPPIDADTLPALAFHADQTGDDEAAVRYGMAAAERAAGLGANREAADMYAVALRHADAAPVGRKVALLEQHAFANYLSGAPLAAAQSWRSAATLRHTLGDRLGESEDLRFLSHVLWPLGRTTEAVEAGVAALRLVEADAQSPQRAWSLVNLAEIAAFGYDPAAMGYAARAIELGTQLGEPAVVIRARCYAAVSTVLRTGSGWQDVESAWREAMSTDSLAQHAGLMGAMMCWAAALHLELDRAASYIAETTAFCDDHDFGMFQALALAAGARVALYRGDWSQAAACAEDVLTRPGLSPLHRILPLVTLALIRARRGQQPVAPLLDEAMAAAEPNDLFRLGAVWAARAEVAWLAGDDDLARVGAQQGIYALNATADPWLGAHLYRWEQIPGSAPTIGLVDDRITPYRLEIIGDWRAAAEEWTRRGCPYDAALAQLGGDVAATEAALSTFHRLGAHAAARRARQRLAQLRGRTPYGQNADTRADPKGLTRRQRDVLELLAVGHSDADIAAQLCISPKTVAKHVGAILIKLGVRNRTQAATYAVSRTPD